MESKNLILFLRSLLLAALVLFASIGNTYSEQLNHIAKKETISKLNDSTDNNNQEDQEEDTPTVISETVLVNNISIGFSFVGIAKNVYKIFGFAIPVIRDFVPNIEGISTSLLEYFIVLTQYIIAPHAP